MQRQSILSLSALSLISGLTLVAANPCRRTERYRAGRRRDRHPVRLVKDNPQVKSFGHCQLCQRGAEQGRFDEDQVSIPGAEGWKE
jgi:hypothetical protein